MVFAHLYNPALSSNTYFNDELEDFYEQRIGLIITIIISVGSFSKPCSYSLCLLKRVFKSAAMSKELRKKSQSEAITLYLTHFPCTLDIQGLMGKPKQKLIKASAV